MNDEALSPPTGDSGPGIDLHSAALSPAGYYVLIEYPDGTRVVLDHARVRRYGDAATQELIGSAHEAGATFTCITFGCRLPLGVHRREGVWIIHALANTSKDHACPTFSKGAHAKGAAIRIASGDPDHFSIRMPKWICRLLEKENSPRKAGAECRRTLTSRLAIRSLLREILKRAGVLRWSPESKRTNEEIRVAIAHAVRSLRVNREPLTERLTVALDGHAAALDNLLDWLASNTRPGRVPLRYAMVELQSVSMTQDGALLWIHGVDTGLPLDPFQVREFKKSWYREYCKLVSRSADDARVLAIVGLYIDKTRSPRVESITPQLTSPEWMAAESRKEARFFHQCALEGLTFSRSFDRDEKFGTVQDLTIHIHGYDVRGEVMGLGNEAYLARLANKIDSYKKARIPNFVADARRSRQPPEVTPLVIAAILEVDPGALAHLVLACRRRPRSFLDRPSPTNADGRAGTART